LTRDTHLARREPYDRWLGRLARGRRLQPLSHLPRRSLWAFQPARYLSTSSRSSASTSTSDCFNSSIRRASVPRRRTAQRGLPMSAAAKSERSCFPSTGCHGVMASAETRRQLREFHIKPLVDESCREPDPKSCARSATLAAPEIVPQRDLRRGFAAQSIVRLNCPVAVSPAPSVTWIVKE